MKTSFWTKLLDLVVPRLCVSCGGRLSPNEGVLCATCHLHLPLTGFEAVPTDNPMARLFWGQIPLERAVAWFYYEPGTVTGHLIHSMKYHGRSDVAMMMGQMVARQLAANRFFDGMDLLVPVPLHPRRQRQRGYNQSMEIARGVASVVPLPVADRVVRRVLFHDSQTRLSASGRIQNVQDAFQLADGTQLKGRHVLLIDDVVTTGSTILACAQELMKATPAHISVLSLGLTLYR